MNGHGIDRRNSQDPTRDAVAVRARELFERTSSRLDIATANRLRLARRDAQSPASRHRSLRLLLPIGTAAAVMLAIGLAWWLPREQTPAHAAVAIEAAQEAYIADEDAEVYAWLGEAPVATTGDKAGAL